MTKQEQKRFNEACKKANIAGWKKQILKIAVQIAIDEKVKGLSNPMSKLSKYVLTGKKP